MFETNTTNGLHNSHVHLNGKVRLQVLAVGKVSNFWYVHRLGSHLSKFGGVFPKLRRKYIFFRKLRKIEARISKINAKH